jgi:putative transposase
VFSRNGAVMTETLETVTKKKPEPTAEQVAAEELVRRAREQGLSLTGPDGLLKQLTKVVIETALDQEMTEHLGHERNIPAGNETGNVRNGARPKTVLTEGTGQVGIEVPRDPDGTFEPQIVKKRQRQLNGVDEIVLSLYAKGLTTGRSARTSPGSTAPRSRKRPSAGHRQGDRGDAGLGRPAAGRDYAAIGVTLAGEKDILGLWAGTGGEGGRSSG